MHVAEFIEINSEKRLPPSEAYRLWSEALVFHMQLHDLLCLCEPYFLTCKWLLNRIATCSVLGGFSKKSL